jgi:hypothetical protein
MVGRTDDEDRVGAAFGRVQRRERHRRRRIATHRLEQQRRRGQLELAQLVEHQESMFLVADDARCSHLDVGARERAQALHRLLEQARVPLQHEKLLRMLGARQRPEAGAAPAGHDDGLNGDGWVHGESQSKF